MSFIGLHSILPLLSVIAFYLLWVIMYQNETIEGLKITVQEHQFADGTPLKTTYLGSSLLDQALSTLVAFTYDHTCGPDAAARLLMIDVVSTLQTAALWCLIDSLRRGRRAYLLAVPSVWGLVWNGFGAALVLPLYIFVHLRNHPRGHEIPLPHAQVLIPTIFIASFLPAYMTLLPPVSRSPFQHQNIIALFQFTPLCVTVLQHAFAAGLKSFSIGSKPHRNADVSFVRGSYMFTAIMSTLAHLYVLRSILSLGIFRQVYIPGFDDDVRSSGLQKVAAGAHVFLQYDFIIINLSALIWSYALVKQVKVVKTMKLVWVLVTADALLGPGAMVSAVFWWRERRIREATKN